MMNGQMRIAYDIYNQVYTQYNPSAESQMERAQLATHLLEKTEFTYGEVIYEHFMPMIKVIKPQEGEVMWDVGCGGAKPLAIAALNFPQLKAVKGIEFLPKLA